MLAFFEIAHTFCNALLFSKRQMAQGYCVASKAISKAAAPSRGKEWVGDEARVYHIFKSGTHHAVPKTINLTYAELGADENHSFNVRVL